MRTGFAGRADGATLAALDQARCFTIAALIVHATAGTPIRVKRPLDSILGEAVAKHRAGMIKDNRIILARRRPQQARLASGETELVSNCLVLTEGWDMPDVGCCVLARPTKKMGLYRQMIGRVRISGQFSARLIGMLESPAYRALSASAHRVIARIEIELAAHGGNDNGSLPVTYRNFVDYGITRECVAPALREAEMLGFIEITKHGRGGNAEHRESTMFRLTFTHDRGGRQRPPTHEWRRIKSIEEARQIAATARANKNPEAVKFGHWANRNKFRSRCGKSTPKPIRETHTEK
jgi:hypothetical protein